MVEDGPTKSPVSIDVGLKATLEVKAEVPKKSVGKVVESLLDIIRPFTEARGLKADQIRFQREDVLTAIALKARNRAEIEHISLNPVPTKLLVPFLEKASIEDVDLSMQDRWAALLLSASRHYEARQLTFVDILSRVSSDELNLLEKVCFAHPKFPEMSYPEGHQVANFHAITQAAASAEEWVHAKSTNTVFKAFCRHCALVYGEIMHVGIRAGLGLAYHYTENGLLGNPGFNSIEILERERLVEIERQNASGMGVIDIVYFNVTPLGVNFVLACSPRAAEIVAARQPTTTSAKAEDH